MKAIYGIQTPGPTSQLLRHAQQRAGDLRFEYHADGRTVLRENTATTETWRYRWTADGRLAEVETADGDGWHYRYDPLGRRIAKENRGGDRVEFVWDGHLLAGEIRSDRTTRWEWRPGSFVPLAQVEESSTADDDVDTAFFAIVADLAGRPTELVTAAGEVVWQSGARLWGGEQDGRCPLRFPGQYHDVESGLHYNHQRYYDPGTARYLSPDPLGLAPAPDPHGYVSNPTFGRPARHVALSVQ